jgi:hypothetical protein
MKRLMFLAVIVLLALSLAVQFAPVYADAPTSRDPVDDASITVEPRADATPTPWAYPVITAVPDPYPLPLEGSTPDLLVSQFLKILRLAR